MAASTVPSVQSPGLHCVVTSPVCLTRACQTPALSTVWCSWQASLTSTLSRYPCSLPFNHSLLFITIQENFHSHFLAAARAGKTFFWTVQPSAASWLTAHTKSYHWLIQRSLMQLKYFWQRNNKKMKCFKCLAKFATIDEKGLSKQVYPWDHSSVVYSNSSINHKTICKDLPKREE